MKNSGFRYCSKINFALFVCFLINLCWMSSCGNSAKKTSSPINRRLGAEFTKQNINAFRGKMSLSDSGEVLLFTSGKNGQLETFISTAKIGKIPPTPSLLLSTGIKQEGFSNRASELSSYVSPDGSKVLILASGTDASPNTLYFTSIASAQQNLQQVSTPSNSLLSNVFFSDDGTVFSFTSTDTDSGIHSVYIGTTSAPKTTKLLTQSDGNEIGYFFVSSAGAPYVLVLSQYDDINAQTVFYKTSFTSLASAIRGTTANREKELFYKANATALTSRNYTPSQGAGKMYLIESIAGASLPSIQPLGNANIIVSGGYKDKSSNQTQKLLAVDLSSAKESSFTGTTWGMDFASIGFSNKTAFFGIGVSSVFFRCKDSSSGNDLAEAYGRGLLTLTSSQNTWVFPTLSGSKYTTSTTPCVPQNTTLDSPLDQLVLNRNATTDSYRLVYTSFRNSVPNLYVLDHETTQNTLSHLP